MGAKYPVLRSVMFAIFLGFMTVSCSDEPNAEDKAANQVGTTVTESGDSDYDDVANDKSFIEETATEFLNQVQSVDKDDALLALANDFVAHYGKYCLPKSMRGSTYTKHPAARLMLQLQSSLNNGDFYGLSSAYMTFLYAYPFFAGECAPQDGHIAWEVVKESANSTLRFTDSNGELCEICAEPSALKTGYSIPASIHITIKQGSEILAEADVTSDFAEGTKATVDVDVKIGSLNVVSKISALDNLTSHDVDVFVGSTKLVSSSVQSEGSNLANRSLMTSILSLESKERLYSLFTDATSSVDLLGNMQFKSKIDGSMPALVSALDFDRDEDGTAQNYATDAASVVNSIVVTDLYYKGTSRLRGSVTWLPVVGTRTNYWHVQPIMTFMRDHSTCEYLKIFNNNSLVDIETLWDDMLASYEALWH
jgi:hypothetical protein